MINRNKDEQEYQELLKDQKLQKTVENETSILKNLIICCLVAFGFISLIENTNDFIFITIFITHLLLSLNNQKLMDRYITGYITHIHEISKVLATISKSHYNFIYIKSALFLIFYLIYIAMPSAYILYDLSLCIMIFEITMVFYYYIGKNTFYNFYIAYLYKRVDLYVKNDFYAQVIEEKFEKEFEN